MANYRKVELLSPAGSPKGFYGAIHGGADAVYLAGNRFGARAYAENFTAEELLECIRYGHLMGRKLYLTVNTLLKETEFEALSDYLRPFYEAGLDAVIVQDLGVLRFVREQFPGLDIHVSTQMTLCSSHGAWLLKSMGAGRIVPARELGLQELISMKQKVDIEIETFIHGAMCYCYSGQCLFSSILGGRSGNRGRCAQPCRLPYAVAAGKVKRKNCYPLSLKDMCTIEHIPQLIEAGIDSFKIEGRMKKPEYTAGVTDVYRRYIDRYYELREKKGPEEAAQAYRVEKEDFRILSSLYIRSEIQDGYYFKRNGHEMVTMTNPAYSGSDDALLAEIHEKYVKEPLKLPVVIAAEFKTGLPAKVTLRWKDIAVHVTGPCVEQAQKQPVTEENVVKQLGRLGDSAFYGAELQVSVDGDAFYPLKQINELRRAAVSKLEQQILSARGYEDRGLRSGYSDEKSSSEGAEGRTKGRTKGREEANPANADMREPVPMGYAVSVRTASQLRAVTDWLISNFHQESVNPPMRIYVDGDLLLELFSGGSTDSPADDSAAGTFEGILSSCEIWAALPYIVRASDSRYLDVLCEKAKESGLVKGFLVRSMDGIGYLKKKGNALPYRADAGIYAWNESAVQEISSLTEGFCLPYELNASEQRTLLNKIPLSQRICEKIVYGRIPMMISANCLLRTADKCGKGSGTAVVLTDRYQKNFPVLRNCLHCMNIIYNSVPLSLHQELSKWRGRADLRMDFTLESASEVIQLLDSFLKDLPFPQKEYTTGHEKRGVE